MNNKKPVYIVDGLRTPYLKARGRPGPFSASDLAVAAARALLLRQPFLPPQIGETITGCIMPSEDEANIARIISLRAGCGKDVPAWTVQRNCGSGMQALDCALEDIQLGRYDLVLAGGAESMSRTPLLFQPAMVNWLANLSSAKSFVAKLKVFASFRPYYLAPIVALIRGLRDPLVGLNMGQTAEELAFRFHITREEMDAFSLRSHKRLRIAQEGGFLTEITPLIDKAGRVYKIDEGVRADTTLEKLAELKPFFDKKFGLVTAGNSSQITDGATQLLLASEKAVQQYNLPVMGRIVDVQWAALNPEVMGLGPVMAATPMLIRNQLSLNDIEYWEINEAFAAQVLACLKAWEDAEFCRHNLGLDGAFGHLDQDRLNIDGGAIAIGHPVGSSGARIVLHLLHVLKRKNAKIGVAGICIGGGQGGAMLIERL